MPRIEVKCLCVLVLEDGTRASRANRRPIARQSRACRSTKRKSMAVGPHVGVSDRLDHYREWGFSHSGADV